MLSWLSKLLSKIAPRYADYETALQVIREGDKAALELMLRHTPSLIKASYSMSGSLLHNAAMDGQVEITKMLIAMGANVNDASTRDKEVPIHFAAQAGRLETVKVLVEHGAKVDILCDCSTQSPLDRAVWPNGGAHKDVIRYLVANGAKHSSIHVASVLGDVALAEDALKNGDEVNSHDRTGWTPLHWAVQGSDTARAMIDFLVSRGADVEGTASKGTATPLYIAALNGNRAAVEALLAHDADVNAEATLGGKPFLAAQSNGHKDIAKLLLDNGADACTATAFGETALHDAVADNDLDMLRDLLERGCDPNSVSAIMPVRLPNGQRAWEVTRNTFTPLHIAANRGYTLAAKLLIEHGADVNKQDNEGHTPLHSAAKEGRTETATLLLSQGADPTIKNRKGKTPLDVAHQAGQDEFVYAVQDWMRNSNGT